MCLEDYNVVDHHGNQHHHHLQLIVDPQEHGARHQAQDTTVDEVLETEKTTKTTTIKVSEPTPCLHQAERRGFNYCNVLSVNKLLTAISQ